MKTRMEALALARLLPPCFFFYLACSTNGDFVNDGAANTKPRANTLSGVPAVVFNVTADGVSDK